MQHTAQIVSRQVIPEPEWVQILSATFPRHTELFARILQARNIQAPEALSNSMKDLMHYRSMLGLNVAVNVLSDAILQGQRIVIVGDFDADGATSTALCILALNAMGHQNVQYIVPNRFDFGYGLSVPLVEIAHEEYQADILLTVDNGISAHEGVERANQLGIKVIVTDHHLAGDTLPNATAIVNPNQPDCAFMGKNSAGVGVAFYMLSALRAELQSREWFTSHRPMPNLAEFLDLVALGTVADVVKLDQNNRILVYQGVERIKRKRCRPGILALLDVAGKVAEKLTVSDLGFILGPRLNAAGRLDDMSIGIECLIAQDPFVARQLAEQLDQFNRERKQIEQSMRDDAEAHLASLQLNPNDLPPVLVLFQDSFHEGVIGIVAGRIKEQCYRPTIVFADAGDGELKGSARSIPGLHIRDALERVNTRHPTLIKKFGGHAMAAGLTLAASDLEKFECALSEVISELGSDLPKTAQVQTDGALHASQLELGLAKQLEQLCVWGQGCPAPIFDNVFTIINQRIVGEKHLKLLLSLDGQTIDAIAFNVDVTQWPNLNCQEIHAAYSLNVNEFRGNETVQCLIHTFQPV